MGASTSDVEQGSYGVAANDGSRGSTLMAVPIGTFTSVGYVGVVLQAEGAGSVFLLAGRVIMPQGEALTVVSGGSGRLKYGDAAGLGEQANRVSQEDGII